jgi:phosphohistidine phosphatase
MLLILIRHAQAVPVGEEGVTDDFHRHLTPFGRRQAEAVARHLAEAGVRLDAVLASPLTRARETAAPLAALLPPGVEVRESPPFASGRMEESAAAAEVAADGETVAVVGHMPDLAHFSAWLGAVVGGFETAQAVAVRFPAGPARGQGRVEWSFVPPGR